MKDFLLTIIFSLLISCNTEGDKNKSYDSEKHIVPIKTTKIDCDYFENDQTDTTFFVNGESVTVLLKSVCIGDYVIYDTIFYKDTTINIFQNRVINIEFKYPDTSFTTTITKEMIKKDYGDNSTLNKSIFIRPNFDRIDLQNRKIYLYVFFCYPHSAEGDFGEFLKFSVSFEGEVEFEGYSQI